MLDIERDRIFADWLSDHKGILFKVVHAYAFEHADRQDLLQEIVIQVWHTVDAFRGESSVPTWIYRVARNTAIAWTRKEERQQRGKPPLDVVEGLLTTSSSDGCVVSGLCQIPSETPAKHRDLRGHSNADPAFSTFR